MTWWEAVLLVVGGFTAGSINTVAGGGSMLTVPLLVLAGVPGTSANGSNRVGILASNMAAAANFRRLGIEGLSHASRVLAPVVVGALVGSFGVSRVLDDAAFERVFGFLMIPLVILTVRSPKVVQNARAWHPAVTAVVFLLVGVYGGAFQAGLGLLLVASLARAGFDLVTANSIKVLVNTAITLVALPVFILDGRVDWVPAIVLAAGFVVGGWFGARLAVVGGEVLIRRAMVVAALALAGRLIGLY